MTRMLLGGCGITVVGGIVLAMVLAHGIGSYASSQGKDAGGMLAAGVMLLVVLGGIAMMVFGLFSGLKLSSGGGASATMRHLPQVTIASRFAINTVGEMIFDNFEFDAPGGKLYVQLRFPDGHIEEMGTAWGVFCQCGEGMKGAAMVKGSWLASFAPMIAQAEPLRNPDF